MPRCQRVQIVGLCLMAGVLASGCDPKPPTPKAGEAASSGASPTGIKPAESGDKVEATTSHKGPSEGGAAVGGMSGPGGGSPSTGGAAPAPSGGDGTTPAPK